MFNAVGYRDGVRNGAFAVVGVNGHGSGSGDRIRNGILVRVHIADAGAFIEGQLRFHILTGVIRPENNLRNYLIIFHFETSPVHIGEKRLYISVIVRRGRV